MIKSILNVKKHKLLINDLKENFIVTTDFKNFVPKFIVGKYITQNIMIFDFNCYNIRTKKVYDGIILMYDNSIFAIYIISLKLIILNHFYYSHNALRDIVTKSFCKYFTKSSKIPTVNQFHKIENTNRIYKKHKINYLITVIDSPLEYIYF